MLTTTRGTERRSTQVMRELGDASAVASPSSTSKVEDFAQFYRQCLPMLLRFLRSTTDSAEVSDIAQEAMINVFQNWSTINSPEAYAITVARRLLYRRQAQAVQRQKAAMELERDPCVRVSTPSPEHIYGEEQVVREVLRQLPPTQRRVITAFSYGMSPMEIAGFLALKPSTVRSHLQLARRRLRDQLAMDHEV